MKLQDKHKYDSTVVGLQNLYAIDNEGNFFINSPAIITPDATLIPKSSYLLIITKNVENAKMYPVVFLDAYIKDGVVYLFVEDMLTQRVFTLDLCLECTDKKNSWIIIDVKYFNKLKDYQAIKAYCGNCL
jgi:hypothetical protein